MNTSFAVTRSHPAAGNSHRVRPRYERPRWDLADCAACRTMPRAFAPVKPRTAHGPVVGFVEIAVGDAARHAYEIAGLGPSPYPVKFEVEHTFLHEDEFVLGRMNMYRYELSRIAVRFERKGRICHCLRKVQLTENVPALAAVSGAVSRNAFLQVAHISFLLPLDATERIAYLSH